MRLLAWNICCFVVFMALLFAFGSTMNRDGAIGLGFAWTASAVASREWYRHH